MNQTGFPNKNVPAPLHPAGSPALQSERMLFLREVSPADNLRDYLSIFFKQKTCIIASFLVLSVLGIVLAIVYNTWIYEPKFQARSSLLVKFGWENYSPDLSLEKRETPSQNQNEILGSEVRILDSRELKERVISFLKPETIFPRLARAPYQGLSNSDAALVLLEKGLSVSAGKRGNIIEVTFEGNDPARAAAVVNQLVNYYIDKRTEIYRDPKSVLFLEKKADEYRQKLVESEGRLKAFSEETGIVSFDDQRNMFLKQRSDLAIALSGAANEITEVHERISELEKQLSAIPKTEMTATTNDKARDAESRLLGLQLQEKDLVSKYKEDNLLVANVRSQIAMVNKFIAKLSADKDKPGATSADPVAQDVQKQIVNNRAELSALKVRYSATQKQLGELNTEMQTFEASENRYKELMRDISANEEKYRNCQQRLEAAKVYDELDRQKMTSVSVIEPAGVPIVPVNPMKPLPLLIAAAIGVGIIGSFAIAYVRGVSRHVMSTAAEAEKKLDLPVLVTIPVKY